MIRRPQAIAALAAAAVALTAGFLCEPAAAKSKPACWKLVLNDWYDGSITGTYPIHCYRDALGHLSSDLEGYTSARDDINRALQQRLAAIAAAKHKKKRTDAPPTGKGGTN